MEDGPGGVWRIGKELRIAIAGMGTMGSIYLDCFRRIAACRVTAVASRSAHCDAFAVYPTLDALLDAEQPDVVCICTPTDRHVPQVSSVLSHGIHVICEKPLALTRSEAETLYDLAERNNVRLFPAQVVRFARSSRWLREAVISGRYGPVREAFFSRLSTRPRWCRDNWAYDRARSGHVPFDLHIHDLDLIVSLFGKPQTASYRGAGNRQLPFDEHIWVDYGYPDFTVRTESAWYIADLPFSATWRVHFENALAVQQGGTVTVFEGDQPPLVIGEGIRHDTGFHIPATDMYDQELRYFLNCIRTGASADLLPREEILSVLEILEKLK